MQFTATTPLALILCLVILNLGPARGLLLLFGAMPFGSAAAVNLSGLGSVFVAEIAMLSLGLSTLLRGAGARDILAILHPRSAGFALSCVIIVSGIGALFLPRLYAGATDVFVVMRQVDGAAIVRIPLQSTSANISQYFRFVLCSLAFLTGALVALRFASLHIAKHALFVATTIHIGLAVADLISPVIGLNLLDPFRNAFVAILDNQRLLGVRRLIAGFPEPSAFGIYTIGLYGFWLRIWFAAPWAISSNILVGILILLLLRSTSTAAYVGFAFYTLLFFLWEIRSAARRKIVTILYVILTFTIPVAVGSAVLVYSLIPAIADFLNTILIEKFDSSSGSERMAWNLQALVNFFDTNGLGAGIGSVRASGWPFAVLGSIGALGAALYLWFLLKVFAARLSGTSSTRQSRDILGALQSGCAAILLLACTIVPQPNLGLPFFVLAGMVTGYRVGSFRQSRKQRAEALSKSGIFQSVRI